MYRSEILDAWVIKPRLQGAKAAELGEETPQRGSLVHEWQLSAGEGALTVPAQFFFGDAFHRLDGPEVAIRLTVKAQPYPCRQIEHDDFIARSA